MAERSDNAGIKYAELADLFSGLGMMVQSGITASEAVSLMRDDAEDDLRSVLGSMAESLQAGMGLADSMRKTGVFPEYAAELIAASEYTGRLEDALHHLAAYYKAGGRMRQTLISSVRYPSVLMLMVIAVLTVLLVMVFPAFYGVYENLAGGIDASSYRYIGVSFMLCRIVLAVLVICALLVLAGALAWRSGKRDRVLAVLNRFRPVRELAENVYLYRFSSGFSMFISAGENQDDAMERSMSAAGDGAVRERLGRCRELMREGRSFSQAAYETDLYERAACRRLMSAERSGMLDRAMDELTVSLREEAEKRASDIADTAEPALTGAMMIFIGVILVTLMLPLIGIMNSIG